MTLVEQEPNVQQTITLKTREVETNPMPQLLKPLTPEQTQEITDLRIRVMSTLTYRAELAIPFLELLFDAKMENRPVPRGELIALHSIISPSNPDDPETATRTRAIIGALRIRLRKHNADIISQANRYSILTESELTKQLSSSDGDYLTSADLVSACNRALDIQTVRKMFYTLLKEMPDIKEQLLRVKDPKDNKRRYLIPRHLFGQIVNLLNTMPSSRTPKNGNSEDQYSDSDQVDKPRKKPSSSRINPFSVYLTPKPQSSQNPLEKENPFTSPQEEIAINSSFIVLSILLERDIDNIPPIEELFDKALHGDGCYNAFTVSQILNDSSLNRLKRFFRNNFPLILEESWDATDTDTKMPKTQQEIIEICQKLKDRYDKKRVIQEVFSRFEIQVPQEYL